MDIGALRPRLLGAGLSKGFETIQFLANGVKAQGTVTQLVLHNDEAAFRPQIAFAARNGDTYQFVSSAGSSTPTHRVGDIVHVLYPANNPAAARIDGFAEHWMLPLFFCVFGILFISLAHKLLFRRGRLAQISRCIETEAKTKGHITYIDTSRDEANGRQMYRVCVDASAPVSGTLTTYISDPIPFDPKGQRPEKALAVYVDPNQTNRYYVDLTWLQEPPAPPFWKHFMWLGGKTT